MAYEEMRVVAARHIDLRGVSVLDVGECSPGRMPDVYRWRFNFMVFRTTILGKSVEFPRTLEIGNISGFHLRPRMHLINAISRTRLARSNDRFPLLQHARILLAK